MKKRLCTVLVTVLLVTLYAVGVATAQSYWDNPWNSLPSNTGNPFVGTSPMFQQPSQPVVQYPNYYYPYYVRRNCASFVADITIPDGSYVAPGTSFVKTWRIRNNGSTTWNTNYKVVFAGGTQMGGPNWFALPYNVAPGQTVDISVNLTAPSSSGSYRSSWKLQSDSGETFGVGANCQVAFYADIRTYAYSYNPYPWYYGWGTYPYYWYDYYNPCAWSDKDWCEYWVANNGDWNTFTPIW